MLIGVGYIGYGVFVKKKDVPRKNQENKPIQLKQEISGVGESMRAFVRRFVAGRREKSPDTTSDMPPAQADQARQARTYPVSIGTETLYLELADSEYAQTYGLTNRASLPKDQGMLYVVTKKQEFSYWAKDMLFATDVVWLGPDFTVVDISENIVPESYPKIFKPKGAARYVIEMNAGSVLRSGVRIGDRIDFSYILDEKK